MAAYIPRAAQKGGSDAKVLIHEAAVPPRRFFVVSREPNVTVAPIRPTSRQAADLEVVLGLDTDALQRILLQLRAPQPITIHAAGLKKLASDEFGDERAGALIRSLLTLATIARHNGMTAPDAVLAVTSGLELAGWGKDGRLKLWENHTPIFEKLLDERIVRMTAKALDLAHDFPNFCISARILTDIRPVFDDDDSTILGAVVAQTLRLDYATRDGHRSISVALDADDVARLLRSCQRASAKANTAVTAVRQHLRDGFIAGEYTYAKL